MTHLSSGGAARLSCSLHLFISSISLASTTARIEEGSGGYSRFESGLLCRIVSGEEVEAVQYTTVHVYVLQWRISS